MFFNHICTEGQLCFVPDLVIALMGSIAAILLGTGLRDAIAKNGQGK